MIVPLFDFHYKTDVLAGLAVLDVLVKSFYYKIFFFIVNLTMKKIIVKLTLMIFSPPSTLV